MRFQDWALIGLVSLVFAPAIAAMAGVWTTLDYYSHGFFVPVVAFWIFLHDVPRLGAPAHDGRGLIALAAALALLLLGMGVGSVTLQGIGFVGAVAGVTLRLYGPQGLRVLAFPIAFLLFMVPLPPAILSPVIVALQLAVSTVAVDLMHLVGVPVLRDGNVLLLPGGVSLFVAEACSGITSIVTLLPLGVMLAYFTEPRWPHRLAIVAVVIPVAMLGNLLRVVATVWIAEVYGAEHAPEGAFHEMAGIVTFVLACLGVIAAGTAVRWLPGREPQAAGPG